MISINPRNYDDGYESLISMTQKMKIKDFLTKEESSNIEENIKNKHFKISFPIKAICKENNKNK